MSKLEATIREFTNPVGDQYPRPWMTTLQDPCEAEVFIVGMNQAKTFSVAEIGEHDEYMDALFNRNGQTCRGLYDRITQGIPSPTRSNIDDLNRRLRDHGVSAILETNVICYGTRMSADLARPEHHAGRQRGAELFSFLVSEIEPCVLIVHGAGAAKKLAAALGLPNLPAEPTGPDQFAIQRSSNNGTTRAVFVIPSLAPPRWNTWQRWALSYLDRLAGKVAEEVAGRSRS
jgi:hypothetical protein